MTDNILNVAYRLQQEHEMAKRKLAEPVREVAHIVCYMTGSDTPTIVRYHDMRDAQKQFAKLLEAADKAEAFALTSPCMTAYFRFPQNIAIAYLTDVEGSNSLMADTQKRMNAMMQA